MEGKPLVPKLRFPEFRQSAPWDVLNGDRLFDMVDRRPAPLGLPVLAITQEQGAISRDDIDYHVSVTAASIASYKEVRPADFIISLRSFQGGIEYSRVHGICSPAYVILKRKGDGFDDFYRQLFKSPRFIQQITRNIEGLRDGKMISYKQFSEQLLPAPSPPEQQKIAGCLTSLDELIAAEGRKLEALRTYKKGLMQNLFPREGETVPRLRFPEFRNDGEWEDSRLSDHVDLVSGMHLSPDQYAQEGEIPYFTGPSDYTNHPAAVTKRTRRTPSAGVRHDTLITVKGSGVGELWHLELPLVAIGRQLMAVRARALPSGFIYQFLLTKRTRFEALAAGNLIPGLSRGDILDLIAPMPSPTEGECIADCLTSLDALITPQAKKLDTLKSHKQCLMQGLFPSTEVTA